MPPEGPAQMATTKILLVAAFSCLLMAGVELTGNSGISAAASEQRPRLFELNEDMLQAFDRASTIDIKDPRTVLHALLSQIGSEAEIFPSEDYYYFSFYDHSLAYSGNLRLAPDSRDKGLLELNYYESYNRWQPREAGTEATLGPGEGVEVTRLGRFLYRVAYKDAAVTFKLHELKMELSPGTKLLKGEEYVGSLYDESGVEFDLIYSAPRNWFMFLLKTTKSGNEYLNDIGHNILVGKRTGFAYYKDVPYNRLILVAVNADKVYENSYYDGPFDQLPENYYDEIKFLDYVYRVYPELKGKLTPNGTYDDGSIFAIFAYTEYRSLSDLNYVRKCGPRGGKRNRFYNCILGHRRG
jgi:hypothetical protein